MPLLEGCGAQFECKTWNVYDGGDHLIIVGEVIEYSHNDSKTPLVFSRGSYSITSQHPALNSESAEHSNSDFLNDFLLYQLNSTISQYRKELYPILIDGCNVTPEHWRILTILKQSATSDFGELSDLVMQPERDLRQSLEMLKELGVIECNADAISLTSKGVELQSELFCIAKKHEAEFLSRLSTDEVSALKNGLKRIVESL